MRMTPDDFYIYDACTDGYLPTDAETVRVKLNCLPIWLLEWDDDGGIVNHLCNNGNYRYSCAGEALKEGRCNCGEELPTALVTMTRLLT